MKKILNATVAEIGILLGVGGGFWKLLQPPVGAYPEVFSGFIAAATLGAALGVRATLNSWGATRGLITIILVVALIFLVVAVACFPIYVVGRSNMVFDYKLAGGEIVETVRGTEYHPDIATIKWAESKTDEDLLNDFGEGGIEAREFVWPRESLIEAERWLAVWYMLTALTTLFSSMLFVEVLRMQMHQTKPKAGAKAKAAG